MLKTEQAKAMIKHAFACFYDYDFKTYLDKNRKEREGSRSFSNVQESIL